MSKLRMFHKLDHQRGDTIVEVLMSVAVLGLVFGAAYVSSNRNVLTGRATQERLEAVKLAEAQVERLRVAVSETPTINNRSTSFCIAKAGSAVVDTSDNACKMSANGTPVDSTVTPRYRVSIAPPVSFSYGTVAGSRYEVTVAWEAVNGNGDDNLKTYYELFR